MCSINFSTKAITVFAVDSSSGVTLPALGSGCAQAVFDLVDQGFSVEHFVAGNQANVMYNLVRIDVGG